MAMFVKRAGGAVILVAILGTSSLARAEDAPPPPAQEPCGFPCLFRPAAAPQTSQVQTSQVQTSQVQISQVQISQAQNAPGGAGQAAAEADPADATSPTAASEKPVIHKKKPPRPLTIAADTAEIARLKGLASLVPGQPIKVVAALAGRGGRPRTDMAVTTRAASDQGGAMAGGKALEARLFTERLHVVAGPGIARIADLRDRAVSFGPAGGPSEAAGRAAFAALGIPVKEVPLDLDNALDGAASGDIDAVVVLAPQPLARLAGITNSGLHLLAWPDGAPPPQGLVATVIAAEDYPGLAKPGETIRAVGVDALLTTSAKGAREPATKSFFAALARHAAALSRRGFELLKADGESRAGRRVASAERRATP